MLVSFQLLIALRFYACGSFQQVVGDTVGVEKSTVCRIVRRVSLALSRLLPQYCNWPTEERKNEIKAGFFQVAGFPGVVGCIDGTHVRIQVGSVIPLILQLFQDKAGIHKLKIYEPPHIPTMWFPNRPDTNRAVQAQKMARDLKFWI